MSSLNGSSVRARLTVQQGGHLLCTQPTSVWFLALNMVLWALQKVSLNIDLGASLGHCRDAPKTKKEITLGNLLGIALTWDNG